jgi:hypothetical protein
VPKNHEPGYNRSLLRHAARCVHLALRFNHRVFRRTQGLEPMAVVVSNCLVC